MDGQGDGAGRVPKHTSVERIGDFELVVTRIFDAPPHIVFRAWSEAALFRRWWVPESLPGVSLVSCEMDVRTGGAYRLEYGAEGGDTMAFHGRYLDVVPQQRIVWTNDEGDAGAITTVTFSDQGGKTLLTFHERYPSHQEREDALEGSAAALSEQFDQLGGLAATIVV